MLFVLSTVSAADLSDYPDMFIKDGKFKGLLVVGDEGSPVDVISAVNIALSLQKTAIADGGKRIDVSSTKLASEVDDLTNRDAVLVGPACDNPWVAHFAEARSCENAFGLKTGQALIKYMTRGDNHYLIVTGKTAADVHRAAAVVSNFESNADLLQGNHVVLSKFVPIKILKPQVKNLVKIERKKAKLVDNSDSNNAKNHITIVRAVNHAEDSNIASAILSHSKTRNTETTKPTIQVSHAALENHRRVLAASSDVVVKKLVSGNAVTVDYSAVKNIPQKVFILKH